MRKILIIASDTKNASVEMLSQSLKKNKKNSFDIVVWQVDAENIVEIKDGHIFLKSRLSKTDFFKNPEISFLDLALIIKRTCGQVNAEVIDICTQLEKAGVQILNGSDFMSWSRSKIEQYRSLKEHAILPETICFDASNVNNILMNYNEEKIFKIVDDLTLKFPIIFKESSGSRGKGVFLVENSEALKIVLKVKFELFRGSILNGFLLQEAIKISLDEKLSQYYRVNIVGSNVHSVIQFNLRWIKLEKYKEDVYFLRSDKANENHPVEKSFFDHINFKKIMNLCPVNNGIVGIDILLSISDNKIYLLEFNGTPSIAEIVELGSKNTGYAGSEQCALFSEKIAELCLDVALWKSSNKTFPVQLQ